MSTLGSDAARYANVLFGRRMFLENAGTNRGATLFLMIV